MREMLADDIGMGTNDVRARAIVEAIFADIRDRKFLEYLWDDDPDNRGAYGHIDSPLGIEVLRDIADKWTDIVRSRLP